MEGGQLRLELLVVGGVPGDVPEWDLWRNYGPDRYERHFVG